MADPPRLTKTRCQMGRSDETAGKAFLEDVTSELKTWPATPVEASLRTLSQGCLETLSALLPLNREQPGSVSHSHIVDFWLPIFDWKNVGW